MIVVTTKGIPGHRITEVKGIVFGSIVRGNISIKGKEPAQIAEQLRWQAVERLMANATAIGANAVVHMHFETSIVTRNATEEIVAYGTGVIVERDDERSAQP